MGLHHHFPGKVNRRIQVVFDINNRSATKQGSTIIAVFRQLSLDCGAKVGLNFKLLHRLVASVHMSIDLDLHCSNVSAQSGLSLLFITPVVGLTTALGYKSVGTLLPFFAPVRAGKAAVKLRQNLVQMRQALFPLLLCRIEGLRRRGVLDFQLPNGFPSRIDDLFGQIKRNLSGILELDLTSVRLLLFAQLVKAFFVADLLCDKPLGSVSFWQCIDLRAQTQRLPVGKYPSKVNIQLCLVFNQLLDLLLGIGLVGGGRGNALQ